MTIINLITEVQKYSSEISSFNPGVDIKKISELEQNLGYKLPNSFKNFLSKCNGFSIFGDQIYGIHNDDKNIDLLSNYLFEKNEAKNPIFDYLLPITPDGFGNHYCLNLNTVTESGEECKVVFWQHDFEYDKTDLPDIDTETFEMFFIEMMDNLKHEINYDGSEKF